MVASCSVTGCKERHITGSPVTFHAFPRDPVRRRLWADAMQRKNYYPSKSAKICSNHFAPECFDTQKFGGSWLRSTAVPTIFPTHKIKIEDIVLKPSSEDTSKTASCTPPQKGEIVLKRYFKPEFEKPKYVPEKNQKVIIEAKSCAAKAKTGVQQSSTKRKMYRYVGDFKDEEPLTPDQLQERWIIAKKQLQKQHRLIKALRGQKRRLCARNASMMKIIERVKKKYLLTNEDLRIMKGTNETALNEMLDLSPMKEEILDDTEEELSSGNSADNSATENLDDSVESANMEDVILPDVLPIIVNVSSISGDDDEESPSRKSKLSLVRPRAKKTESRDECSIFGEFVASKLRKFQQERSLLVAQDRITNVLFEMDMERLNQNDTLTFCPKMPCDLPTPSKKTTTAPIVTLVRPATSNS